MSKLAVPYSDKDTNAEINVKNKKNIEKLEQEIGNPNNITIDDTKLIALQNDVI